MEGNFLLWLHYTEVSQNTFFLPLVGTQDLFWGVVEHRRVFFFLSPGSAYAAQAGQEL